MRRKQQARHQARHSVALLAPAQCRLHLAGLARAYVLVPAFAQPGELHSIKKLRIGSDVNGNLELQDVNGLSAIDIDGRVRRDALTLWTDPATLPAAEDDEVEGKDGR